MTRETPLTSETFISRRAALGTMLLGGATLALAACGSSGGKPGHSVGNAATGGASASTDGASRAGYPVTIDTAWGKLTVDKKPERIVALQACFLDVLSSLGDKPIAFVPGEGETTAQQVASDLPWLTGKFSADQINTGLDSAGKISAEAVAALKPDLILGNVFTIPQKQYAQFSQIAPTYVGRDKTIATSWNDRLTDIGALTGQASKAAQVIADVNAKYAAAKQKLPGLQGKTYIEVFDQNNQFYLNALSWAPALGLVPGHGMPTGFSATAKPISLENIGKLDSDVLFIATGLSSTDSSNPIRKQLEADPNFTALPAYKNGAVLYLTSQIAQAQVSNPGPLSMTWLLGQVMPELENSALNKK